MEIIDISYYPTIAFWVRILSTFGFVLNGVGLAAVVYGNPSVLAHYRRYLIVYQFYSMLTDLMIGGLALPVLAFPDTGGFSIGILTNIGVSTELQLLFGMHLIGGLFGAKIVIFLERQQAALQQDHPLRLHKNIHQAVTIALYAAPMVLAITMAIILTFNNVQEAIDIGLQRYPELEGFILHPDYFGFEAGLDLAVSILMFVLCIAAGAIIGLTTLPSLYSFRAQQLILSEKTLRMQKKWLFNLIIQTLLLCVMVLTPLFYGLITYFTQQIWLAAYTIWTTVLFTQQGAAMTTLNFILFKSYRRFVRRRLFGRVYGKTKGTQIALESLTVFVVTRNAATIIPKRERRR